MKATEDIFRAYDIRGVYGSELDAEVGERVGLAFGNFLRKEHSSGKISIGCDARVSSPELQLAVSKGVSRAGFDVDIIGMVPTIILRPGCACLFQYRHAPKVNFVPDLHGKEFLQFDQYHNLQFRELKGTFQ